MILKIKKMLRRLPSMTKKEAILACSFFALLSITASAFIGCSSKEAKEVVALSSSTKKEPTTINFIGHWLAEGLREDLVRDVARNYEFKNQDIRINLTFREQTYYVANDMAYNQRYVATEMKKEVGTSDILFINDDFEGIEQQAKDPEWASKYLVDFSVMPEFRKYTMPSLLSDTIKKRWNGIIPGPFIEGVFWSFWFNRDVAKKVGIEIKQFGMTFDDFESYIAAVHAYNLKNPNDTINAIFEAGDWQTVLAFAVQLYATVLNDDVEFNATNRSEKKLEAWHSTLKLLERLAKYQPIEKDWKKLSWIATTKTMLEGKYLFYCNGSWMYNIWNKQDAQKTNACIPSEFPSVNPAKTYVGGYNIIWAVPKNAPHKEEAIKLLLSINQPTFAEMWVRYTKCPTGITGNLTEVNFGSDQVENFSYVMQKRFGTHTYKQNGNSEHMFGVKNASVSEYMHEVILGEMTADQAMRKIRSQLK